MDYAVSVWEKPPTLARSGPECVPRTTSTQCWPVWNMHSQRSRNSKTMSRQGERKAGMFEGWVTTCAFMISADLEGPGSFVSRVIGSRPHSSLSILRTESILEKLSSKRFPGARPSFKARAMMNQCGVFHAGRERRFVLRHWAPSTQADSLC